MQEDQFPYSDHIQKVTDLMLRIEKGMYQKEKLDKKLRDKEAKWELQDRSSRQRRIILENLSNLNMMASFDADAYMQMANRRQRAHNLSGKAYELIFQMISYIFERNRMPSINYLGEINGLI